MDNFSRRPSASTTSGVGVLDKSIRILDSLELGPQSLAELTEMTAIPRPTLHRLASALEAHQLVGRDSTGRYILGPRLPELAAAQTQDRLATAARNVLVKLRDQTGESAQLFRRTGDARKCIAVADRVSGLRDTVPLGVKLPLTAGSAAQILLAWENPSMTADLIAQSVFDQTVLESVRLRGWAQSIEEREAGVASVSVPVRTPGGLVLAAMSVSGPKERLGTHPGETHAAALLTAATELGAKVFEET